MRFFHGFFVFFLEFLALIYAEFCAFYRVYSLACFDDVLSFCDFFYR